MTGIESIPVQSVSLFCRDCAEKQFKDWRGWALKANALPNLPVMKDGDCMQCGSTRHLSSVNILWQNIGPGLPDHWVLIIDDDENKYDNSWYRKWGFPYFSNSECPHCGNEVLVNHVRTPIKTNNQPQEVQDFSLSCKSCGLMSLDGKIYKDIDL